MCFFFFNSVNLYCKFSYHKETATQKPYQSYTWRNCLRKKTYLCLLLSYNKMEELKMVNAKKNLNKRNNISYIFRILVNRNNYENEE